MAHVAMGGVTDRVEHSRTGSVTWWAIGLVAVVVALHVRTFGSGLYLDDYALARPWGFREAVGVFWGEFDTAGFNDAYYRPFASVSFALEWPVWGTWKVGYHITNLVLHALAGCGVLLVLRRVHVPAWAAFVGAVYFVAVPANVTTVVYIAERTDAMVAIGVAAALLCVHRYHRTREVWALVALSGSLVLAVLAKEVGVAIIPMVAVYWWYLRVDDLAPASAAVAASSTGVVDHWRDELRVMGRALVDRGGRRDWLRLLVPPILVAALYIAYRTAVLPSGSLGGRFGETQNPISSLVGGLNSTFKGAPWEVTAFAAVPLAIGVAGALVLRPTSLTWRVVLLGLGLMVGGVLPLTFSGGVEPRLLYVAEIGMAVVVGGIVAIYAEAIAARRGATRTLLTAATACLGLVLVATTIVAMAKAQDEFVEGSQKKLDADQRIFSDALLRPYVEPEHLAAIEQRLREAGRL